MRNMIKNAPKSGADRVSVPANCDMVLLKVKNLKSLMAPPRMVTAAAYKVKK